MLGEMSTAMTHLLAREGSFFSKAGSNIEASHNNEELQVLSAVANRESLLMKFGFLERVRLGHAFSQNIPVVAQCNQLVQIAMMGNPTFLDSKISGSSQQGLGGIFMTNYVSASFCSAFLCSQLHGALRPSGINHSE